MLRDKIEGLQQDYECPRYLIELSFREFDVILVMDWLCNTQNYTLIVL